MKKIVKNEIPKWAEKFIIEKKSVAVDDCEYEYHILKKETELKLPCFVGYRDAKFLLISEEVPEEFRPFMLAHEIRENTVLNGKRGRCLDSLKLELHDVPPEILTRYLLYRFSFFEKMVDYVAENKEGYAEDFESEIQASLEFLKELVSFLAID